MISVVIPTYNEEKYLGKLLDDLKNQDFGEDIEVIVSDADSKDATREIAGGYKKYFENLKIVQGGMPAVGRNNGGKASSGDPIFFIDADMLIPDKNFLRNSVNYFRERKFDIAPSYLKPESDSWFDNLMVNLYNIWLRISKYVRASGSMCIVASRDMFNKSGGYPEDEILCEDHNFVYKCSKLGRFGILPFSIIFSMRRFDKEGRALLLWKYLLSSLHLIFIGPVKKPIIKYEFGYTEKSINEEKHKP